MKTIKVWPRPKLHIHDIYYMYMWLSFRHRAIWIESQHLANLFVMVFVAPRICALEIMLWPGLCLLASFLSKYLQAKQGSNKKKKR